MEVYLHGYFHNLAKILCFLWSRKMKSTNELLFFWNSNHCTITLRQTDLTQNKMSKTTLNENTFFIPQSTLSYKGYRHRSSTIILLDLHSVQFILFSSVSCDISISSATSLVPNGASLCDYFVLILFFFCNYCFQFLVKSFFSNLF